MADVVVYEDSPLAQYLKEIQGDQQGTDLQHTTVPVNDPEPPPPFIGFRLAHNAVDALTHVVEYLSHTFSSSATEKEDTEFEERFKYFICTSPFLNRTATFHTHERGRRTDVVETLEYASKFNPGRFGLALGFGTLVALIARSILVRTKIARLPLLWLLLSRPAAASLALASSAWILRILQRRNMKVTQNQALRSLQLLVNHCLSLDIKVNRAIMVIQEIELVSRGYRLSTPLAPISRIEQASKTRRCNIVRAQLIAALAKSGTLFQKSTETLQSHIDYKRLSTLLDMYNAAPSPSPRPNSPGSNEGADSVTPRFSEHRHVTLNNEINTATEPDNDRLTMTASPTSDIHSPLPSTFSQHIRQRSSSWRQSRNFTVPSRQNTRPHSFHEIGHSIQTNVDLSGPSNGRRTNRRHRTSWSASEGEESDNGTAYAGYSPRSSTYSNIDSPTLVNNVPEMTTLERLRRNFQKMHVNRREFLCELMSIRRKSRNGRHGFSALKDYDQNWTVVRDVLQEGVTGIELVVEELSKVLDSELYTLPRIDTQVNKENSAQDKQLQPFVHRIALLEQHVRGVQAKLFICNEDIRETIREEPLDAEKRRLLELQFESISEDISMMATEWQLGKTALNHVFEPSAARLALEQQQQQKAILAAEQENHNLNEETQEILGPIIDSMEPLDDQQRLMYLAAKREETWEASTESELGGFSSRRPVFVGADGVKMTRAERIQQQKILREQEELKKERIYDSSKMVNELKGVLGRRRHLRENDEDDQKDQPYSGSTSFVLAELALPLSSSSATGTTKGYSMINTSTPTEKNEDTPSEHISPLCLSKPIFERESNSFAATLEQRLEEQVESSYIEISGVGEAEEEEGDAEVENQEEPSITTTTSSS
ncbi:hypothetical protein BGX21_009931 [Mortierella sp. AD011]|nr:hypothetical protein BGX21_009931 [Mortierella sp. AD011]